MEPNETSAASIRTEEQVEYLVADIGRVIRSAEPDKRGGLKQLAEALLHEEVVTIPEDTPQTQAAPERSRLNPLAPGILLILLGLGLMVIIPLIGVTLAVIGLIMAVWGGVISGFRKSRV